MIKALKIEELSEVQHKNITSATKTSEHAPHGLIMSIIILKEIMCSNCPPHFPFWCYETYVMPETPNLKPISGAFPYLNYLKDLALSLGSVKETRQNGCLHCI